MGETMDSTPTVIQFITQFTVGFTRMCWVAVLMLIMGVALIPLACAQAVFSFALPQE